ncbi:AraC-like DNA-binding protein [Rhizobium sp. BK529]|nr:AraC-like DNA-binding protein [Rhizobium sp. BK529]
MALNGAGGCSIELVYSGVERHRDRHQMELMSYSLLRLCRHLAGSHLAPSEVRFAHHRSGDMRLIRQLFGCDVTFNAKADQLRFPESMANLRLVTSDPYLSALMKSTCDEALERRDRKRGTFRSMVENAIAPLLPHAEANAAAVADKLGLTERTFARRLSDEGLSFTRVLDEMRRELMLSYLEQGVPISQIAWLLGFGQPTSLSHACKRWVGKSPMEWRRSLRFG